MRLEKLISTTNILVSVGGRIYNNAGDAETWKLQSWGLGLITWRRWQSSSILAWKRSWTRRPGRFSRGLQRVRPRLKWLQYLHTPQISQHQEMKNLDCNLCTWIASSFSTSHLCAGLHNHFNLGIWPLVPALPWWSHVIHVAAVKISLKLFPLKWLAKTNVRVTMH